MSLVTLKEAKTKNCKVIERINSQSIFGFLRSKKCEGSVCAHWNFSGAQEALRASDLDEEGFITKEALEREGCATEEDFMYSLYKGYCGYSTPIEELWTTASADELKSTKF